MNSSRLFDTATRLKSGRNRKRPPTTITPMPIKAGIRASRPCAPTPVPALVPASIATVIRIGATARSCASNTAKTPRPDAVRNALRSASTGRTTAVDDRASAIPSVAAPERLALIIRNKAARASEQTAICAAPRPKIMRRIDLSRSNVNSRPMVNSRNTTPNSARAWTLCERIKANPSKTGQVPTRRPTPSGPSNTPTSKKPSTPDTLKRWNRGTTTADARRKTMITT